ncbi:MAG: acyltransferase [Lachnospiraceae bacterium]|nr:acyltransferase [Lachnospiraceae bacterium]
MSDAKQKRQPWLDILRAFAILCVVLCHCVEGVYSFDAASVQTLGGVHRIFVISMYTLGRVGGVPLFLMLSGYLLLDREYDSKGCVSFWKHNWLRLLICTEIWIVFYELFLLAYQNQPIPFGYLVRAMLFLEPSSMYHMWYMPMLLGLYLLLPFVAMALRKVDVKILKFPMLVLFAYAFGVPGYTLIANLLAKVPPVNQFSLGFSGGMYGIYLIAGYLLKKGFFAKLKRWVLWILLVISFTGMVALQFYAYGKGVAMAVWYDCPLVPVCAVCLFELTARDRERIAYNPFTEALSRYAFAIFLIHIVVRAVILPWITGLDIWRPIQMCFAWDAFTLISLLIAMLLAKIPKVGKYILYIK